MAAISTHQITKLEVEKLKHCRNWIRQGKVEKAAIAALAGSLVALKQQVPIIVYGEYVIDGNCRLLAALLAGLKFLDAIVLDHEPTQLELLEIQLAIDVHRTSLTTTQRAAALASIQQTVGCTVTELAKRVGLTQGMCSKLLPIATASNEIKALLDAGLIDIEKAAILCANPDPAIIAQAPTSSREQLRQKIKAHGKPVVKAMSVRLPLPGQMFINLRGPSFDMPTLIEVLQEAAKLVKKAMNSGHDVSSVQRYLKRGQ